MKKGMFLRFMKVQFCMNRCISLYFAEGPIHKTAKNPASISGIKGKKAKNPVLKYEYGEKSGIFFYKTVYF